MSVTDILTGVTGGSGSAVTDGWSVFAEYLYPWIWIETAGDDIANASAKTNIDENDFFISEYSG
ncbi:MAG: hypothetical protein PVG45_12420 [Gammaproteobacteria bacterium]|jgi:hypothetical protein